MKARFRLLNSRLTLPIVTGLLIGTSYIPFYPWAMLFGLVPLAVSVYDEASKEESRKRAFLNGWISQFILTLIGFHWISYTAVEFGHFPVWAGALVLLGFAAVGHVYYALAALLTVTLSSPRRPGVFFAFFFASFAAIESAWPSIFPWHLGYPWLWANLPGAQFADVIGFEGLNLVSLTCNALIAYGWIQARNSKSKLEPTKWIGAAVALFLAVNILGLGREKIWNETDRSSRVLIVQGNIGNYEKLIAELDKDFARPIIKKYVDLTTAGWKAHPESNLAIWPETAFADFLDERFESEFNWQVLKNFVLAQNRTVLTGAYSYDATIKQTYNGFFAMGPQGRLLTAAYHKTTLIPFGEKFPFSDIIPYTKWLFPGMGSFGAGSGPVVMDLPAFKLGPQVCLDSLDPKFAAGSAKNGAEVLSNVTNDSWFGRTFEPYQHLTMTAARAVENRRPLIRATNTGISTVVLADGRQLETSPLGTEWFGVYDVRFKSNPPLAIYSKIAGYSGWLAFFVSICLFAFSYWRRRDG